MHCELYVIVMMSEEAALRLSLLPTFLTKYFSRSVMEKTNSGGKTNILIAALIIC